MLCLLKRWYPNQSCQNWCCFPILSLLDLFFITMHSRSMVEATSCFHSCESVVYAGSLTYELAFYWHIPCTSMQISFWFSEILPVDFIVIAVLFLFVNRICLSSSATINSPASLDWDIVSLLQEAQDCEISFLVLTSNASDPSGWVQRWHTDGHRICISCTTASTTASSNFLMPSLSDNYSMILSSVVHVWCDSCIDAKGISL